MSLEWHPELGEPFHLLLCYQGHMKDFHLPGPWACATISNFLGAQSDITGSQ